jgi:PAS domain S-box-containing protein
VYEHLLCDDENLTSLMMGSFGCSGKDHLSLFFQRHKFRSNPVIHKTKMNPCLRYSHPVAKQSFRAFSTAPPPSSRTLSTRLQPDNNFLEDEFPMKLEHYLQKRTELHPQKLQDRWAKLATLTLDPKIAQVSRSLNNKQGTLPTTLTQVMADERPCMIMSVDDPFTIINVNQSWCEFSGYTKDEALNQKLSNLLHGPESSLEQEQYLVERVQYGHDASGIVTHYSKDGSKFQDMMRFGTIAIGADVSNQYIVCVLQKVNK